MVTHQSAPLLIVLDPLLQTDSVTESSADISGCLFTLCMCPYLHMCSRCTSLPSTVQCCYQASEPMTILMVGKNETCSERTVPFLICSFL